MPEQRIVTPMTELVIVDEGHRGFHWTFFAQGRWCCEGYASTSAKCIRDCDNTLCPI